MKQVKKICWETINGLSTGIVLALVPGVLVSLLVKWLTPIWPQIQILNFLTGMATILLPVMGGICVGMTAKLTPIQTGAVAIAAMCGAGNVKLSHQQLVVQGSGDVINIAITIMLAEAVILFLGQKLKAYTILLVPLIVIVVAGGIGLVTLPYVQKVTALIGLGVEQLMALQPIVMGTLVGMIFALLIVSPISSVGIASAIGISGVAAGCANLGITAASFALAIYGWRVNSIGTSLAHFLGSPKMQMPNLMAKPKLLIPVLINAGLLGALGAIFKVTGTTQSAGFGFSGLIGPATALEQMGTTSGNWLIVLSLFLILPIGLGLISNRIFNHRLFNSQDFQLSFA